MVVTQNFDKGLKCFYLSKLLLSSTLYREWGDQFFWTPKFFGQIIFWPKIFYDLKFLNSEQQGKETTNTWEKLIILGGGSKFTQSFQVHKNVWKGYLKVPKNRNLDWKISPKFYKFLSSVKGGGVKHFHIVPKFKIVPKGERVRRALENFTMF